MKYLALLFLIIFTSCNFDKSESSNEHILKQVEESNQQWKMTTYYLIRHSEKDRTDPTEKDPELNSEGIARAQNWATILKDVPFNAIYSTNYKRTKATEQPIADSKNLQIETYDPEDMYNADFQEKTKGKSVLIVGHSNTTPAFANAIYGNGNYPDLPDDENGALFIVSVSPSNLISTQVLYIN